MHGLEKIIEHALAWEREAVAGRRSAWVQWGGASERGQPPTAPMRRSRRTNVVLQHSQCVADFHWFGISDLHMPEVCLLRSMPKVAM